MPKDAALNRLAGAAEDIRRYGDFRYAANAGLLLLRRGTQVLNWPVRLVLLSLLS